MMTKTSLQPVSNFIVLIQFYLICRMLVKFSGVVSERTIFKVTRPSFFFFFFFEGGGYHPTLKLSAIPTFTFIVSLTHRMDNI